MTISASAANLLLNLPDGLRQDLFEAFEEVVSNYREGRWEPSELNGGKLCEVVHSILRGYVDGIFPARASKPPNMVDACRALEQATNTFPRSVRIQIPRMLVALYEIRNNRGVGHVGGDVDPNHMDATAVLAMSKWVLSEVVRVFHGVDTMAATELVETLVQRETPIIWEVAGRKRLLNTRLTHKEKVLLFLYTSPSSLPEAQLLAWTEHPNGSKFRNDVLRKLHRERSVEYDESTRTVHLSPLGVVLCEGRLLKKLPEATT